MKYSIIIPIYNTEKYLERCIDSVLNQTFKDFELILVNDGSKDNSLQICKEFEKHNDRVVLIDKENGGVSSARNVGIEASKGDFLLFFDSDDFVELTLLETIDKFSADLIAFNSTTLENKLITINKKNLQYDFFCGKLMEELFFSPCNKVFLSKIVKEYDIKFDEKIHIGEDMLFSYEYLTHCFNVQILNNILYFYNRHNDSAMNNSNKDYLPQYILTLDALENTIGNNTFVLSSWSLDVVAIIFIRQFFSNMKHKDFLKYMRSFEETKLRNYAIKCKDKKTKSKKVMSFLIKHKMYGLLHIAIKVRA